MRKHLVIIIIITIAIVFGYGYSYSLKISQVKAVETVTNDIFMGKYPLFHFDDDYTDTEKVFIESIIMDSCLIDLNIFGNIYFFKISNDTYGAQTNRSGRILINKKLLTNSDTLGLKKTISHELGHLFDFYVLTDEDRKTYAQLRAISNVSTISTDWYRWFKNDAHQANNSDWKQNPAEDFAEVFAFTFFKQTGEIQTAYSKDMSPETSDLLYKIYNEMSQYALSGLKHHLTANAEAKMSQLTINANNKAKIITLPSIYGPWMYLHQRMDTSDEEYVFTATNRKAQGNGQIFQYYNPIGYEKYNSYFQKYADEIIYYQGENYYLLNNQGVEKDHLYITDGVAVLTTDDQDLDKYDLIYMLKEASEFSLP